MHTDSACEVRCLHPEAVQRATQALEAEPDLIGMASLFAAFGDPTRLRLLLALQIEPLCTCDLAVVLGVSESAVSHQLRTLKSLDLVKSERRDRMMFHRLTSTITEALSAVARSHVVGSLTSAEAA